MKKRLQIPRIYTIPGQNVFETCDWEVSEIFDANGRSLGHLEFPSFWSPAARQQVAEKYFRKADVPQFPEGILDRWALADAGWGLEGCEIGGETSLKHVVNRLAGTIRFWGDTYGYFRTLEDSQAFYDEMAYAMIHQFGALNSPQWFNTGMYWAYGIKGEAKGQWYYDFKENKARLSDNAYERPQAHACFILGVEDNLFDHKGIYYTAELEAKIFYFGSGTGSAYSTLRGKGEAVSGGGKSSGMMSFLKLFDAGGGIIKSGGKNRRAAKMDICHDTHPELIEFIRWKMREEKKVRILIEAGMDNHFEGEAYNTVSGMNSNNTVALSHDFFKALRDATKWELRHVTNPAHVSSVHDAKDIWDEIVYATWFSGDPGIHAKGTINEWHTCPEDGPIVASNPCSEYLFLDETACNLASLNLVKFYDAERNVFDVESYRAVARLFTTALDITVSMAQYPSKEFAEKSIQFRTLGLGYSNLGALLMIMGYGYDTNEGRSVAGAITAILGAEAYVQSAIMADAIGQYEGFERNREHHLRVIRNHRAAAHNRHDWFEGLTIKPMTLSASHFPMEHIELLHEAKMSWDDALVLGEAYGFRNAQATVLAPTGTISWAMDCDTFGGEPDFALKKYKLLAGGGWLESINRLVPTALKRLGYTDKQIGDEHTEGTIVHYVFQTGMMEGAPFVRPEHYPVFDTAVKPKNGTRYLQPSAHIAMMAYQQPFLSGAISKTVNLPEEATETDISAAYLDGYYSGLKAIAVFRDKSKASSVMYTSKEDQQSKREPLDLNSRVFDVKSIFGAQFPLFDDVVPEANQEVAAAVEMPTYGCKDGSCSI